MQLTHTGTLGRQGIHTAACPLSCPSLPPLEPQRLMRVLVAFYYSAQHLVRKLGFFSQLKGLLKESPVSFFPSSSQPIKLWAASFHPWLVAGRSQLPRYLFLTKQVSDCCCYTSQPPWEADEWSCAPETWTYNLQHAICVASYLAEALVPGVPKIYLQIDHVMSKMKWKVIVIVDYIIRKQESECLTNGNTWNTCRKS